MTSAGGYETIVVNPDTLYKELLKKPGKLIIKGGCAVLYITDTTLEDFIKEDVPFIDLTTLILGIGDSMGEIRFVARDNAIIAGTEEVTRVFKKLDIEILNVLPSGTAARAGDTFIEARGNAGNLHMAWKVSQNILEYCSGIATRTFHLVSRAKGVNPKIEIVTTRKIFPGTKELSIKAVLAGGGLPHRLGLSETVLIFKQHLNFIGGIDRFIELFEEIRCRACEKKIIVEVASMEDAVKLCQAGVDGIQFDKLLPDELKLAVAAVRNLNAKITLIATGGINESNIEDYARTGVDAVATTSVYFGKPVDIGAKITMI